MTSRATGTTIEGEEYSETASDSFTRLNIAMCPDDDGTRPVNPNWAGADTGYRSPAFYFTPTYPLQAGQQTMIHIMIRNFGTMHATNVLLECTYNIFIGNQNQGNNFITTQHIPLVPSGGEVTVEVPWTPPDTQAIHGCVHARVFDTYSIVNYPVRTSKWSSFINPQAGNRNVRLVPIQDNTQAIVVPFLARNFLDIPIRSRLLVTEVNSRYRFHDLEARFPLPFDLERRVEAGVLEPLATAPIRLGDFRRDVSGRRFERVAGSRLWPRDDVADRFLHNRFGFDTVGVFAGHAVNSFDALTRPKADFDRSQAHTYMDLDIAIGQNKEINLVIPPEELPPRGRRRVFQVDYQTGHSRPVQHFVYLVH